MNKELSVQKTQICEGQNIRQLQANLQCGINYEVENYDLRAH